MAESMKAEDKKFEFALRKTHSSSAWAIRSALSASLSARASILWLQDLQASLPPDQVRAHQTLNKLLMAAEYMADTTLSASKYSARAIGSTVASRRLLWLKTWKTDLKSKWRLATDKYSGSKLFGAILDPYVIEDKNKRKILAHPSKGADKRQEFRRQGFRQSGTGEGRQPFRGGQSWDWPRNQRTSSSSQERFQDRPATGRGQFPKRNARGGAGRPYRRSK